MCPHRSKAVAGAIVALAVLTVAACTSSPTAPDDRASPASDVATGPPEGFQEVSETRRLRVEARVDGAVAFTYADEAEVHITRVGMPGANTNILSVGFVLPVKLDDPAERFRWGVDLLNAYDGPGRYEFTTDAGGGLQNIVELVYLRAKDPTADAIYERDQAEAFLDFDELRQACVLEAREPEFTGTLTCPELATESGETVRVTISWEQPTRD